MMAHIVGSVPATAAAKASTLESERAALLDEIRHAVLSTNTVNLHTIVDKVSALKSLDNLDDARAANDVRIVELTKLAGTVHDPVLAAGYEVLGAELLAANSARSGAGRAQALFDELARQVRSLHSQIDAATGEPYTMQLEKAEGADRWVALGVDHRAVAARTRSLPVALPAAAAKAAGYRRQAAAVTDPILRAGYERLANDIENTDQKENL